MSNFYCYEIGVCAYGTFKTFYFIYPCIAIRPFLNHVNAAKKETQILDKQKNSMKNVQERKYFMLNHLQR